MIVTAQGICTRAMRYLGVARIGQAIQGNVMNEVYDVLKTMVDDWKTDSLNILVNLFPEFPLVAGVQSYTIGPGGDFDTTRPVWLTEASVVTYNNPSQPLELPIDTLTVGQWQEVPVKTTQSALPTAVYYEDTFPLGRLYFYPVPNVGYLTAKIYIPTPALNDPFVTLTTQVNVPPSYKAALEYNLAVEAQSLFGRPLDPVIATKAAEKLGNVRRANIKPVIVGVDQALLRQSDLFNYLTGNSVIQGGNR